MRRDDRVTVQGPVKKHQPNGMSHGGRSKPPLSAFERAPLPFPVLLVPFPHWYHRSLFIPIDRMFYEIAQKAHMFVTATKGVGPRRNVTHTTDPVNVGGLGLHHSFWMCRSGFHIPAPMCSPLTPLPRDVSWQPTQRSIRDYVASLKGVHCALCEKSAVFHHR